MLKTGRYLYVAFMCQQAIEKILKAIYIKELADTPPYTHNLTRLLKCLHASKSINTEQLKFMEVMNSYYIESRYTEEIDELAEMLTAKKADEIFQSTKELFSWLRNMI